jgi:hypothetical protein
VQDDLECLLFHSSSMVQQAWLTCRWRRGGGGGEVSLGVRRERMGGCIVLASAVCFLSVLPHPGHCMDKKHGLEVVCDIC